MKDLVKMLGRDQLKNSDKSKFHIWMIIDKNI